VKSSILLVVEVLVSATTGQNPGFTGFKEFKGFKRVRVK